MTSDQHGDTSGIAAYVHNTHSGNWDPVVVYLTGELMLIQPAASSGVDAHPTRKIVLAEVVGIDEVGTSSPPWMSIEVNERAVPPTLLQMQEGHVNLLIDKLHGAQEQAAATRSDQRSPSPDSRPKFGSAPPEVAGDMLKPPSGWAGSAPAPLGSKADLGSRPSTQSQILSRGVLNPARERRQKIVLGAGGVAALALLAFGVIRLTASNQDGNVSSVGPSSSTVRTTRIPPTTLATVPPTTAAPTTTTAPVATIPPTTAVAQQFTAAEVAFLDNTTVYGSKLSSVDPGRQREAVNRAMVFCTLMADTYEVSKSIGFTDEQARLAAATPLKVANDQSGSTETANVIRSAGTYLCPEFAAAVSRAFG